jgi:hypothetical protein
MGRSRFAHHFVEFSRSFLYSGADIMRKLGRGRGKAGEGGWNPPGGFLESCNAGAVRPSSSVNIPSRGGFDFPAPYGTRGIRITNEEDAGVGAFDNLWYCGYSYWSNINMHEGQGEFLVFLSLDRQRGGNGPSLWSVSKDTDTVTAIGPIFSPNHPLSWSTGEGWYWSALQPFVLYASDLTKLYRVDVSPVLARKGDASISTVVDVQKYYPGKVLWQWHSSADEMRHSATIKNGQSYAAEGSIVYDEKTSSWTVYAKKGSYDECQISKSGKWLLTKDNVDGKDGEDNLIYDVDSYGGPRVITDKEGAAGHSDNGWNYMVAADNYNSKPSAFRVWKFDESSTPQGLLTYYTSSWDAELSHISHCNAVDGEPENQFVCGSGASRSAGPRNNEVVAFRLDGSLQVLVVAPTMVDLDAAGGGAEDYAKLPKGNLDYTGQYFLWTSNCGGPRLDAFVVKVPFAKLFNGGGPPSTAEWTVIAPDGSTRKFVEV